MSVSLFDGADAARDRDPAPARARLLAALADLVPIVVLLVAALVVRAVTRWPWWAALVPVGAALLWMGVLWRGACVGGRTVGKRLMGVRVVVEATGTAPRPGVAVRRWVARGVLGLVTLGIAGLSYRWDPAGRQRTWWDRLAGTAVVPDEAGAGPDEQGTARWAPDGDDAPVPAAPAGGWVPPARPAAPPVSGGVPAVSGGVPAVSGAAAAPVAPAVVVPPAAPSWHDDRPEFLARSLIGDAPRAVPVDRQIRADAARPGAKHAADGAAAEGGAAPEGADAGAEGAAGADVARGPGAAVPGRGLITGIGDTGAPVFDGPSPAAPPPAPPSAAPSQAVPSPAVPSPAVPSRPSSSGAHAVDPLRTVRVRAAEAKLVWDTGRHVTVAGRVLIGREPAAAPGEHVDHLLPVSTDSVGVSKTHLQLDVGPAGITVTDRRSTNGVRLAHPDGSVEKCVPGEPVPVRPGDVLHFGGRHIVIGA